MNRLAIAATAAALVAGFGGGVFAGKLIPWSGGHSAAVGAVGAGGPGWDWPLFGKPRDANAPRPGVAKPEGFAVWHTRVDTSAASPLACIQMSRPLDPSKPYGDFVLLSPAADHAPAIRVKDDELCLGGLGFSDRRITLLKGFPARGGETLTANADVDFTFGDKPPYVGFAGDGVILPRTESDGVGIETINVSRLSIEVWRAPDRNLVRRSIAASDPTPEGEEPDNYDDSAPDPEARVVWKGQVAVKGDPGQRVVTVFPLGAVLHEMRPGGYVIKARDISGGRALKTPGNEDDPDAAKPAQARRWVIFTDMALTAYDGADGLDVVVRSLQTAKLIGGTKVALMAADGESLAAADADGQGRVHFAKTLLQGKGSSQAKMLMAYGDKGDLAILDLERPPVDLSSRGTAGREDTGGEAATAGRTLTAPIDGFVYADRGIYRPGETIHLGALLRDREAKAVKDRKGALVIKRPSGVEFQRLAFAPSDLGAVTRDVVLPKTAPRGRWQAELMIEGIDQPVGSMAFSVEDFAPQRLAVTADGNAAKPVGVGESRRVDIQARFLYGAIGAGLQTQAEARLRTDPNPFPQYKDYRWGDALKPFEEKLVDLGNSVTDGEGKAFALVDASAGAQAKAPLQAAVAVSVFEPGGRPVRESLMLKVRPLPLYLGVKIDQGDIAFGQSAPVNLDLIAVDAQGARIAAPGVTWSLISENWDYDWFQQDGRWQWRRTSRDVMVGTGSLDIGASGPARLAKRLGAGDYRIVLDGPSGAHTTLRFSAGWGGPAKESDAPDTVRVSTGGETYAQGDTVEVAIKGPYGGEAQVAVATDRLIDFKTATLGAGGGSVKLKTSAAWGGGAYVLVTIIQPRDPGVTPKPRRALGLIYVPLDPKGRKLTVTLGTASQLRSAAPIDVPVTVAGLGLGQKAHVTIAAVDEGILRLTKFEAPDPVKWYFGKRALTLDYRDDYGRLLDPNLGAAANVDFGGDQIGGEGLTVTPIRTVAMWSGVVDTGYDGKAVVHLPAADFNGQVRVMAVAWTDGAVGSGQSDITVREPVVAELSLPRFLSPGDKAFATIELHNLEGKIGDYIAQVTGANGPIALFKQAFMLMLGQRTVARAPIAAPVSAGVGQVVFRVDGPGGFLATRTYPIQTRTGWSPITRATSEPQAPGAVFTPSPELMRGLAAGSVALQVSYSPFQGFDPAAVAAALSRYPYGCSEQLVSTAYPLLYSSQVGTVAKVNPAALGPAIGQLMDRQSLDGAFGLWRVGDGEADPWLGAYITDFLIQAKAAGAPVPQAGVDRALAAMRQISKPEGWSPVSYRLDYPKTWFVSEDAAKQATARMRSRAAAYALYDLAEGGQGDLPRLRWFHDVQFKSEPSPLARAQIGAALAMMGDRARAHSAFQQASQALGFREPQDDYQSPLRDLAAVIALAYQAGEVDIAHGLQSRLSGTMRDIDSLNTQEQARLLQAASYMLKASSPASIAASGANPLAGAGGTPRWAVGRLADARFVNTGRGPIWRTVTVTGSPIAPPMAQAEGVTVTKRLLGFTGQPVLAANLKQGDRVIVLISGMSRQSRTVSLVINDPLPGGFEIETQLGPDDAQSGPFKFLGKLSEPSVQESRDDRYVAAMTLEGGKPYTLAYVARAVTPGDFFLPGAEARDMYHPAVFARSAPARAVIAPGG
jgi:uncharacterized protein YfaS (alpha-2-macroglobulin family)